MLDPRFTVAAHMLPEACEARFLSLSFHLVSTFLYRLFDSDAKHGVSPLIKPLDEMFLEHRTFPSPRQMTTEAPGLNAE